MMPTLPDVVAAGTRDTEISLGRALDPAGFRRDAFAFDVTCFGPGWRGAARRRRAVVRRWPADHRHLRLLRPRRERPRRYCAAEKRYELAPFDLIELHSVPRCQLGPDCRISNYGPS